MKKTILAPIAVFIITLGVIFFINRSNNHSECGTSIVTSIGEQGEKPTTETHVCKEKYNL